MNIGIVGLGLMGGSFGRALIKRTDNNVFGYDISENVMLKAELMHAINFRLNKENAKTLDLLVIALSPENFESASLMFLPFLKKGAVFTDFCGIKRKIFIKMQDFSNEFKDIKFIGGHPMAGKEKSGIEHSSINLFDNASMLLTNVNANLYDLEALKTLYLKIGFSKVIFTTPENHDKIIAYTSQLCHIVSNAYIKNKSASEHFGFSAGSYKDLSRVARLDANMWADLMLSNRDNLAKELKEIIENLNLYYEALENNDKEKLFNLLKEGSDRKILLDNTKRN